MRKMPFYCTFVRHGETTGNVANLMQCSTGGDLTERGEAMSRALGRHLSEEKFSQVFSSDLNRAVQTTKIILEELKTNPIDVIYSPLLRERAYGDWEMKPVNYPPILNQIAELKLKPEEYHRIPGPPNGETYEEAKARAAKFFEDEILQLVDSPHPQDPSNVLVVSHGIFLMCFLDHLLHSPHLYQLENFDPEQTHSEPSNCSRTRFSISKQHVENHDKRHIIAFTHYLDVQHLRD